MDADGPFFMLQQSPIFDLNWSFDDTLETITPVIEVALACNNIAILKEDYEKVVEYLSWL